jgi:hypothetical protein
VRISSLAFGVAGYVLGARAGRERYEQIVSVARRVAGSQIVQSTAGVVRGQVDQATARTRRLVAERLGGSGSAARRQ